jgi:ferritin
MPRIIEFMSKTSNLTKFHSLLQEQVRHEFTASQQYIALAVWFDGQDLPQLAKHFYKQSLEERNHAMMIVQYLLDNDLAPVIPGIDEVKNDFSSAAELVELALKQEKEVTDEIIKLAKTARDEDDYKGEQFMQWFLKEQVEEVAQMTTLLNIVHRSNGNLFDVENFLARESVGETGGDALAPHAAGGSV